MADIKVRAVPVKDFAIVLVDKAKGSCGENTANAGFFGNYSEQGEKFTLPAGHLVCDYEAESKWVKYYGEQRKNFVGNKARYDASARNEWGTAFDVQFCDKAVSTLLIRNGKASVEDITTLPECDYAISGVPVLRNGGDCKFGAYVSKQGWGAGSLYATWHTFVGVKSDPSVVYVMAMKTTTENMVKSSEAFNAFKAMDFVDVIKLDGGGSFWFNDGGNITRTSENRRINTIIRFDSKDEEPKPFKLALSAGHGIHTNGKRVPAELDKNETSEWWLNDRICDRIEAKLASYDGIQILRMDDSDDGEVNVSLPDRTKTANEWGADFYLSIHHNAAGKVFDGGGIVAYAHTKPKGKSLEWRDELYEALIERTGLRGNRATPKAQSDLYVLRNTDMESTLLELGFMDSRSDLPVILTDEYATACADAIVDVIVRRANLSQKDEVATKSWVREYVASLLK